MVCIDRKNDGLNFSDKLSILLAESKVISDSVTKGVDEVLQAYAWL